MQRNERGILASIHMEVEGKLDLRDIVRREQDTVKLRLSKKIVVLRTSALALEDLDQVTELVVAVCREDRGLLSGQSCCA